MRRSFRTRVCFSGWSPRVGTLGWYAMPRWGMGSETWWSIGSNGAAPTRWNAMPVVAWMRDRNAIVEIAPTGQRIPAQGANPGNRIREKRCVLKEHRIGWAGVDIRDTQLCGVPSERGNFSRCIPRVGTLGWYAMPRQRR